MFIYQNNLFLKQFSGLKWFICITLSVLYYGLLKFFKAIDI